MPFHVMYCNFISKEQQSQEFTDKFLEVFDIPLYRLPKLQCKLAVKRNHRAKYKSNSSNPTCGQLKRLEKVDLPGLRFFAIKTR